MAKKKVSPAKQAVDHQLSEHLRLEVEILETEAEQAEQQDPPEAALSRSRPAKGLGSLVLLAVLSVLLVSAFGSRPSLAVAAPMAWTGERAIDQRNRKRRAGLALQRRRQHQPRQAAADDDDIMTATHLRNP